MTQIAQTAPPQDPAKLLYTQEEADAVRELYSTAVSYITMADSKSQKPEHVFYMHFLGALRYQESNYVPFAGVEFQPGDPTGKLHMNPLHLKNLNLKLMAGLAVHELLHIIMGHVYLDAKDRRKYPKLYNIAFDMAINQIVLKDGYSLPWGKGLLTPTPKQPSAAEADIFPMLPDTVADMINHRIPGMNVKAPKPDESYEYYLLWLVQTLREAWNKQNGEDQKQGGSGGKGKQQGQSGGGGQQQGQGQGNQQGQGQGGGQGQQDPNGQGGGEEEDQDGDGQQDPSEVGDGPRNSVDDLIDELFNQTNHDQWEASEEELTEADKDMIKRVLAQTAQEAMNSAGGMAQLPGHLQGHMKNLLKVLEPKIDWSKRVAEFVGGCGTIEPYVRRRENKHGNLGLVSFKPGAAVGIVVDTSGSVSDTEFRQFMGEAFSIVKDLDMPTYVVETSYGPVEEIWDLAENPVDDAVHRVGYGGTNMRPGVMLFQEQLDDKGPFEVGGVIVLSDGWLGMDSLVKPDEVDFPVLWVFTNDTNPFGNTPFAGEIIYFESEAKKNGLAPKKGKR